MYLLIETQDDEDKSSQSPIKDSECNFQYTASGVREPITVECQQS